MNSPHYPRSRLASETNDVGMIRFAKRHSTLKFCSLMRRSFQACQSNFIIPISQCPDLKGHVPKPSLKCPSKGYQGHDSVMTNGFQWIPMDCMFCKETDLFLFSANRYFHRQNWWSAHPPTIGSPWFTVNDD